HRVLPSFPTRRSSDLRRRTAGEEAVLAEGRQGTFRGAAGASAGSDSRQGAADGGRLLRSDRHRSTALGQLPPEAPGQAVRRYPRSEEHTSELQSRENL